MKALINKLKKIKCRFDWYPNITTWVLTVALSMSLLSSLDCQFLTVQIGFVPHEASFYTDEVTIGLWSMVEASSADVGSGQCVVYTDAHLVDLFQRENGGSIVENTVSEKEETSVTDDQESLANDKYRSPYAGKKLHSNDQSMLAARISAIVGACCGFIAFVVAWFLNVGVLKMGCVSKELLVHTSTAAFLCEGIKIGVFFNVGLCSKPIWPKEIVEDGIVKYVRAQECDIERGGGWSIASLLLYFIAMALIVGFMTRPSYKHGRYGFDEETQVERGNNNFNGIERSVDGTLSTFSRLFAGATASKDPKDNSEEERNRLRRIYMNDQD